MRDSSGPRNRVRAATNHCPSSRLQTGVDHVQRGWRGKAAYWPVRAGRPRWLLAIEPRRMSRAAGVARWCGRRRRSPVPSAPPSPHGPAGLLFTFARKGLWRRLRRKRLWSMAQPSIGCPAQLRLGSRQTGHRTVEDARLGPPELPMHSAPERHPRPAVAHHTVGRGEAHLQYLPQVPNGVSPCPAKPYPTRVRTH
jgi:hypothetical protein